MKDKQRAQGLVEYALILVLEAIVVVAILALLGSTVEEVFSKVVSSLSSGSSENKSLSLDTDSLYKHRIYGDYPNVEKFGEYAFNQEERLGEVGILFREAVDESLGVLIEYAEEVNDQTLFEFATQAEQEAEQGNYPSVQDTIFDIVTGEFGVPLQVQIDVILKVEPMMIDAYWELETAEVSQDVFDAALGEVEAMESQNPGSTNDAIPLMWELWDTVNLRNLFITEVRPQFAEAACIGIAVLKNSGENSNINRAEKFEADIGTCE